MGAVAGRMADVLGGLEVVKWHTGNYAVRLPGVDHPVTWAFIFPRKRNAVAMRVLLLAAWPDWSAMPRSPEGRFDPPPGVKEEVFRLHDLAEDERSRRLRGECLLCGWWQRHACRCGTPTGPGQPRRWAAADMEWAR